jgi:RNA polymerase sigma factor (sigma-70 family)
MEAHSLPRNGRLFLPRSPKVLRAFSDERLVEQVRCGNDDAFEAVYDRHHRGILAFCRHMLSSADQAEDAVQQTFISAYDAMRSDARDIRLKPWLYAIARNRCLSILRARREEPAEIDDIPTVGLSAEVEQRAELRELLRDLHELPVDQRAALVLSEVGGLSHPEVGTVVGCEVAKVKSLVFQARSSLIETRSARDIPCHEIREQLATLTGGALRRGPLRKHIRACEGCAEFRDEVMRQRKALAAILPVVPTVGLKSSLLASIGVGGGGGGAAIGGGAAAGGGMASLATSGAAVKMATLFVVGAVAVGGGLVLNEKSPTRQAEAADGQSGGSQAWPAPAAGTGPGTQKLQNASLPAAADHGAGAPATRKVSPGATVPGSHHGQQPNARGGTRQGSGRHGGRNSSGHNVATPAPTSTVPSASTPASSPAPDGHTNHGNHRGWTQGRGHQHHEQDYGGTHVPGGHSTAQPTPVPSDSGDDKSGGGGHKGSSSDGSQSGDDSHQRADGQHRAVAPLTGELPPAP